jgi:putative ABC transport system permease protein
MRRLLENIKIAFQSLGSNRLRAFLTMLGIIIGVGAVIAMMSIGSGAQQSVIQSVQDIGSNLIIITPGNEERQQQAGPQAMFGDSKDKVSLKIDDIKELDKQSATLVGSIPIIISSSVISYQNKSTRASIYASSEKAKEIYNIEIEDGKFYTESDVSNSANVALVGKTIIDTLFKDVDPIGKIIKIDGKNFTIVGTTKPKGSDQFGNDQDNVVSIPITTAQNRLYGIDYLNMILAQAKDNIDSGKAITEVEKILRRAHHLGKDELNDFTVNSQTQILDMVGTITGIFTIVISSIAGISLLVGGIGIMNIMLVSVTERTREIGIRKAVGAKNRDILVQFLIESTVLSISGGILGILFAVAVTIILSKFTALQTNITGSSILLAISFSTVIGLFFGIYPAMRAARLNPIEALRYE